MARTPEQQAAIEVEVWDRRSQKLRDEELKIRCYELYSLKTPITTIAEKLDIRPLDVYRHIKNSIKDYAVPQGKEATARLAGYAEAALTALEPKVSEGNTASHRAANSWVKTLMELYGIGPQNTVEITNNNISISAEDLPVMQALDAYKVANELIEGELSDVPE